MCDFIIEWYYNKHYTDNIYKLNSCRQHYTDGVYELNLCRLAGLALISPTINYMWPSFPSRLIREDYRRKFVMWTLWLANYCPRLLLQWWVTQKLSSPIAIKKNSTFFNKNDRDIILKTNSGFPLFTKVKIFCMLIQEFNYYVTI
jgi:hypothetical protein